MLINIRDCSGVYIAMIDLTVCLYMYYTHLTDVYVWLHMSEILFDTVCMSPKMYMNYFFLSIHISLLMKVI